MIMDYSKWLTIGLEVLIRTTHLLLMIEEAQGRVLENTGRALIFGSYTG